MNTGVKDVTKRFLQILFWVYFLVVIKLLIFKYPEDLLSDIAANWDKGIILSGLSTANFVPFKTIIMYFKYYARLNSFENIFGNIFIFAPFGFLIPFTWKNKHGAAYATLMGFLFSMGIEMTQLISGFGAFDVDDLILNALGAFLGFWIYKTAKGILIRKSTAE